MIGALMHTIPHDSFLLDALATAYPDSSRSTLRQWIKHGLIAVDGQLVTHPNAEVKKGQSLSKGRRTENLGLGVALYYADREIAVIEKPVGLLSVATDSESDRTAHAVLKKHFVKSRVWPVHRLDRETSGVMLFALTERARDELKKGFEKHAIEREYLAVLEGKLDEDEGVWEAALWEDASFKVHVDATGAKGKRAVTRYQRLGQSRSYTLVTCKLETGKKNQIRAHASWAGHPLAGDKKYGAKTNPAKRLCLHARYLGFDHPVSGKKMEFQSRVPENLQAWIDRSF